MRLSADVRRVLDSRCIGHLATLQPDGSPKVEPVWLGREGDRVWIATDERTLKGRNMRRDPRVALSIVSPDDPYEQVLIRGRVVEIRPDRALEGLDKLSHKYLGRPFPRRDWPSRALYAIEADLARYYKSKLGEPRET